MQLLSPLVLVLMCSQLQCAYGSSLTVCRR
jgi:hypothetical protein